jgi:hypothetical protein
MTDASSEVIAISLAGKTKKVIGNWWNQPEWLIEFAGAIDTSTNTHRWRHGDPKQEHFLGCRSDDHPCDQLSYDGQNPKPGITPLITAVAKSDLRQVTALIKHGANPNEHDASGWTALMYAARSASPDIIDALLRAGADAKLQSFAGELALEAVAGPESLEKRNRLIAAGGNGRD